MEDQHEETMRSIHINARYLKNSLSSITHYKAESIKLLTIDKDTLTNDPSVFYDS